MFVTKEIKSPCAFYSPLDLSDPVPPRHVSATVVPWEQRVQCSPGLLLVGFGV